MTAPETIQSIAYSVSLIAIVTALFWQLFKDCKGIVKQYLKEIEK